MLFSQGKRWTDHPRACGEQAVMATTLITQLGSPPRVRGTVLSPRHGFVGAGITPARAGNSSHLSSIVRIK